eukprot:656141-Rhodomonas_salina.2
MACGTAIACSCSARCGTELAFTTTLSARCPILRSRTVLPDASSKLVLARARCAMTMSPGQKHLSAYAMSGTGLA